MSKNDDNYDPWLDEPLTADELKTINDAYNSQEGGVLWDDLGKTNFSDCVVIAGSGNFRPCKQGKPGCIIQHLAVGDRVEVTKGTERWKTKVTRIDDFGLVWCATLWQRLTGETTIHELKDVRKL